MEQIRVPEAAPEWPSVELGIGEKRSFRKGSTSAFKHPLHVLRVDSVGTRLGLGWDSVGTRLGLIKYPLTTRLWSRLELCERKNEFR